MGTDPNPAAVKKPKRCKWLIRIGVVLIIYTLVGFFVVPAIIKSQMLKRLPALTKRQAAIEQVKCNPYVLSLTIRGFSLKEPNGDVFSSFDEFYGNFQLWASLFKRAWVFDEISLTKPFAQVTYQADGNFNFANLLDNSAPAPKPNAAPQPLPSLLINNLNITNGAIAFDDLKRKVTFHTVFTPINVHFDSLTTIRDKNSPYTFIARTSEGEGFAWSGTVTVNPLRSEGKFRLSSLKLAKYSTYAHDYARFEIAGGLLDVAADYRYDSATNVLDASVSNAVVYLNKLQLKDPDTGETVLAIPTLAVTDTEASVARRTARVGLVKSSGGAILVRQNHDRTINLLSLLTLPSAAPAEVKKSALAEGPAPVAKIDEIAFDNYTITAEDKKPEQAASFTIDQLAFDLKGVSNITNAPVTAAVSFRLQQTGTTSLNGTLTLMPLSADLQIDATNIDLRAIQPYVQEQIKLAITSGAAGLNGRARYASSEPGAPLISFAGNFSLTNFATVDDVLFKDFLKWDALTVDGIKLELQPDKFQVEQVKFTGLNTSLIVGPDHRANLQTILRTQIAAKTNTLPTEAGKTPAAAAKIPNLNVAVGALMLENASLHFADESIEPHCTFDVQEFGGSIKGLSSQAQSTATIDLHGNVDARSPFSVSGKVNPLSDDIYMDIAVAFTNTELTAFTPYTEKYVGRPLQKGKLSFAVHYAINKKALLAENGFYVDQMTLGPKNDSPDATKLPVKLAIALLKDRHGRIQLNVPLSGRIDDPKFRVGPIIWQVVMNLIAKAATSPFSLLGAMFGGGDELSYVSFSPGIAAIPDAETNKLETLAKALYERPEVTLEINGSVDPAQDRAPLAQAEFEQQMKSLYIKEASDAGKPAVAMDQVHLEPADYDRLINAAYKTAFGKYKPSLPPTNQAQAAEASAPPRVPAPAAVASSRLNPEYHGDFYLLRPARPEVAIAAIPPHAATAPAAATAANSSNPAMPPSADESEIAGMKAQLMEKIVVTDDDLRDLMKQRAAAVQAYLLNSQKVTAERLFIIAPKPFDAAFKGEERVNLNLD
jgi:hypothetical protein